MESIIRYWSEKLKPVIWCFRNCQRNWSLAGAFMHGKWALSKWMLTLFINHNNNNNVPNCWQDFRCWWSYRCPFETKISWSFSNRIECSKLHQQYNLQVSSIQYSTLANLWYLTLISKTSEFESISLIFVLLVIPIFGQAPSTATRSDEMASTSSYDSDVEAEQQQSANDSLSVIVIIYDLFQWRMFILKSITVQN